MITKEMSITGIAKEFPKTVEVFFNYGMHCLGCMATHFENLEQGATAHGIDVEKLLIELNKVAE